MKKYFDLTDPLRCDTLLAVKLMRYDGRLGFVHYIIPVVRKDGSIRLYGDLYQYFLKKKPSFRFAIGYHLEEDPRGDYWTAQFQYFYFSKTDPPFESIRLQAHKIFFPKSKNRIAHSYQPQKGD